MRPGPKPKQQPKNCPKCKEEINPKYKYHSYNFKQRKCYACCIRVEVRKSNKKYFPPELVEKVISSYRAGDSIHKISADLDAMKVSSVYTILRNNNIKMRSKSVAIKMYYAKMNSLEA